VRVYIIVLFLPDPPSLRNEMFNVAAEFRRREGVDLPLLFGGATTAASTPRLDQPSTMLRGQTFRPRRSRAVGVPSRALLGSGKKAFVEKSPQRYQRLAEGIRGGRLATSTLYRFARRGRIASRSICVLLYQPPRPARPRHHSFRKCPVAELVPYFDWTPFFATWEIGDYPFAPR